MGVTICNWRHHKEAVKRLEILENLKGGTGVTGNYS